MQTSVYIHGIRGRLGRTVAAVVEADPSTALQDDLEKADVVIDFSAPEALVSLLEKCEAHRKPLVVGTTGHSPQQEEVLQKTSREIPILFSPNFSLGMAVCLEVVKWMAPMVEECDIEIIEAHRRNKKDRPSGTALKLAEAMGRQVPIHSVRAGDIPGDHTVVFAWAGERIELKHQVHSREAFARGAVKAAQFLKARPPGLYSVKDLYGAC